MPKPYPFWNRYLAAGWWIDGTGTLRRPDEKGKPTANSNTPAPESPRKLGRKVRQPNKTEAEFLLMLASIYPGTLIQFEPFTLHCDSCKYTPDAVVSPSPGKPVFRPLVFEVKGPFKRTKDILRLKAAAKQHPYKFTLAEKLKTGWQYTAIRGLCTL